MRIYLFRHGQTPGNAARRYLGVTDEPLSELGIKTAQAAGCDPAVQEVVVSPLRRTQMTAAILFPQARQRVCRGLREMDFGDFEGRSAEEMADDADYRYWVEQTSCMGPCPHGDATLVFQHRVAAAFLREVERLRRDYGADIHTLEIPAIGISSTDIRNRVKSGRTIHYLVPDRVERYIMESGIYRA